MLQSFFIVSSLLVTQIEASKEASEFTDEVAALVQQLDDDLLSNRVAAEKELIALGIKVLDHLPEVTNKTSAEVKQRLSRIRSALEKLAAASATTASHVTLQGTMSLAEALSAVQKQTGNKISVDGLRGGDVKVDFKETPFWQALDVLLDQGEQSINQYGGIANMLSLMSRDENAVDRSERAAYSGIFRFEATQASAVRDLRNPSVNSMRLNVEVAWEPRTVPISLVMPVNQFTALDENGKSLPLDDNRSELGAIVQAEMPMTDFVIPFVLPDRSSKKIASVKGTLNALVPGRQEVFEFANVMKLRDTQKKRGGLTLTFDRVFKNEDVYEFRIRIRVTDVDEAFQSHLVSWIRNNECYLVTPDGKTVGDPNYESYLQANDEIGMKYLFPLDEQPKGYKFVYKTPTAIVKSTFDFELKDIELP